MSRKKNTSCLNISNNKNWNNSWCIYNQQEYHLLFQQDIIFHSYIRSLFSILNNNIIINIRLYRTNNLIIVDLTMNNITFVEKTSLVKLLNNLTLFFNKNVYLVIKKADALSTLKSSFNIAFKIACLIEKRIKFRSKIVKTLLKNVKKSCKGIYVQCTGRINNVDMAKSDKLYIGSVPLQSINANIDYSLVIANTVKGLQSIKVWICK
jgi:small subunit ribosomal protein S3